LGYIPDPAGGEELVHSGGATVPAIAIIEHKLPRRVRVKIPSKRRDTSFFEAVVQKLRQHPNVRDLSANPHTGSVVIHHAGNAEDILSLAFDLFELGDKEKVVKDLKAVASRSGLPLPEILDGTAFAAAGLSVYQLVRRKDLGTASENFWAAFGSYRFLNSPKLAAAFAAVGVVQLLRGELLGSATSLLYYSLLAHQIADVEREEDASAKQPASGRVARDRGV
jgi:hypothetical protein